MRPTGLFLAGCLCSLLLAGRIPNSFSASPNSGVSSPVPATTSAKHETRTEKLQPYRLASELLDRELRKLEDLAKQQEEQAEGLMKSMWREQLGSRMQQTFDRMHDQDLYHAWRVKAAKSLSKEKQAELSDQEAKNVEAIQIQTGAYVVALRNTESDTYKAFMKRYEDLPWRKEVRMQTALVDVLTRERDETRAALMRD